jgi:hypothetical protein
MSVTFSDEQWLAMSAMQAYKEGLSEFPFGDDTYELHIDTEKQLVTWTKKQ